MFSILLSFSQDFPAAKVIRLERNYRSTQKILDAAGAVVANNPDRLGRLCARRMRRAGTFAIFEARDAAGGGGVLWPGNWSGFWGTIPTRRARGVRTNFQSRSFEEAFRRRGVRYKLVGGFSFYNRAEVKGYARVCAAGAASGG